MVVQKSDNVNNTRRPHDVGCHEESSDIRTEEVSSEAEEVKDNHKVMEDISSKEEKTVRRRNEKRNSDVIVMAALCSKEMISL